jgi:hypothetical protein
VVLWARTVLQSFSNPVRFNGRLVLVGDGIKAAKRGKQMPGVKTHLRLIFVHTIGHCELATGSSG